MFTGELPHQHGIHADHRDFSALTRADTFLDGLPSHRALGASANVWAGPAFGFDGLFDQFSAVAPDRRFPAGIDVGRFGQECDADGIRRYSSFLRTALDHPHPIKSLANGAFVAVDDWLASAPIPKLTDDGAKMVLRQGELLAKEAIADDVPFVLFLNLMDAHGPLHHVRGYDRSLSDAPLDWTSRDVDFASALAADDSQDVEYYRGLYGASIEYLDRQVTAFVDRLSRYTTRETSVVVTADHGDHLGHEAEADRARWGHVESCLSEGLLHVPLTILNAPEPVEAADRYVSHLDLGRLVTGLATGTAPDVTRARVPAERIGHSGTLATIDEHRGSEADRTVRCLYDGPRKYEWDSLGGRQLYQVGEHPNSQRSVADTFDPDSLEHPFFDGPISAVVRTERRSGTDDVSPDVADRLDRLGYR
jgi:hypothetical protein